MIFGIIIGISFVLYGMSIAFQKKTTLIVDELADKLKLYEASPQNDNDKAE